MTVSSSKILIVEDNELGLKMAKKLLEMAGYQTIEATNADESIQLAIRQTPDLILMDMHMPGKNGYAASKELKSIPQTAHIPVVAFTALAMPEEQKKALEHGCIGVISKPIDATSFAETVGAYLLAAAMNGGHATGTQANPVSIPHSERLKIALTPRAMSLKELLEPLGYMVFPIPETTTFMPNEHFDLLIIDEPYLAAIDFQTLNDFKSQLSRLGIPSILATSFSSRDILSKALGWVSDYITFPFLALEVEVRVQSALRTNRKRDAFAEDDNMESRLENFLETASHDLQGPIRKISQFVGFLSQAQQPADSESGYYLDGISRNVKKMEAVLANLLSSIRT